MTTKNSMPGTMKAESLRCPQCQSDNVAVPTDPRSGRPSIRSDFVMLQCQQCNRTFSVDTSMLDRFSRLVDGTAIKDHNPCQSCGYDLNGLIVGHRCPECGTQITSPYSLKYAPFRKDTSVWGWLTFLLAFSLAILGLVYATSPSARRPEPFLILAGMAAAGYGTKGILFRRIAFSPKWGSDILTGTSAIICGVMYIAVAIGLFVLTGVFYVHLK